MHVLLASAELSPVARVGGMAEAVAGLVRQLSYDGLQVTVALPDYNDIELHDETIVELDVPSWAGPAHARMGRLPGHGPVAAISAPGIAKPHPYNDADGKAFADNDLRFFSFSAAVAALTRSLQPDVLHVNDWHTAPTLGLLAEHEAPPSVLSIHTLAYQGICDVSWSRRLVRRSRDFIWFGDTNPLLGGIRLADKVVTVSPNYCREILTEEHGMGLQKVLADAGDRVVGIINGIDVNEWDPVTDPHLSDNYNLDDLAPKMKNRLALHHRFGLDIDGPSQPVIGMVTRLVEQKGVDLVIEAARFLDRMPGRLAVLGSGDAELASRLEALAHQHRGRIGFVNEYDAELSHQIFGGADLLAMPSRFEPCGLAQMQAMRYGTIPVVTAVGGLVDTVIDSDVNRNSGTGFVSAEVSVPGLVDALHRACRAWHDGGRLRAIRRRGMSQDWSWAGPSKTYRLLYNELREARS